MRPQPPIHNPIGYYKLGEYWYYLNKTEAVHNAVKYNQPLTWHFHDDIFDKIDWTIRPPGTLQEMYRERAQQIRDEYDYVTINFSGGMDSWTVLHTFLSNNIHVDEVFFRYGFGERKYRDANPYDTSQSNLGSEFEFAALPVLEYVKKHYPKTNVVIHDYTDGFEVDFTEEVMEKAYHWQFLSTFQRFNCKSDFERQAAREGKRIAAVHGYEKIRCAIENGNFYTFFVDGLGGGNMDPEQNLELFYWNRRFPLIPVLQAHCIKDYIITESKIKNRKFGTDPEDQRREFRKIYQASCYPGYSLDTFQVGKPIGTLMWESDMWVKDYNPRYYDSWNWAMKQFTDSTADNYLKKYQGEVAGFHPFRTPRRLVASGLESIENVDWFAKNLVI